METGSRGRALARLAAALSLAATLFAQQVPQRQVERPIDFATSQDDNLFSVLRSQDHIHAFEEGLAEIDAGDHRAGVERLHRLLQIENGGVVPVAPGRFLGLRLAVVIAMANMPQAAHAAYEDLVRREGGAAGDLAQLPAEQLLQLAERFPAAAIGVRARVRLGDLALTAGNGRDAAGHFRLALDATAIGSTEERRAAARLHAARLVVEPAAARAERALAPAGAAAPAADGDVLTVLPALTDGATWPSLGGTGSGRTPMAPLAGEPDTRWNEEVVAPGFGGRDIGNLPMYAVGDLDGIFLDTGYEVVAFEPLRRSVAWVSVSPMREFTQSSVQDYRRRDVNDGINQDMVLAPACDRDVVVAALQVPEKSMNVEFQGNYRVMTKIPMRRLYAFARQSGKVLWSHYDELDGPRTRRFRGHDACASPLIAGDLVYVPTHDRSGAIAFAVSAYDVRTGTPRWRRLVCSSQQDVNMFGNARTEFAASPLCLHDGVLFGASNLGVAYAVEAATGRLRWISSYEVVRMPLARMNHQQDRPVYFANNAPVATGGVVCTTPLDSPFVLGLDVESGRRLWRLPADANVAGVDNRVTWLAGTIGDEFVLAGAGAVAVRARPSAADDVAVRQLVRPEALVDRRSGQQLSGRPAVTADGVWFARADGLLGFDRDGNPLPRSPLRLQRLPPGNLLLVGGIAVSVRQRQIEIAYDAAALRERVEALVAERPNDPGLLLRLASLRGALLPENATPEAVAAVQRTYQQGLDAAIARGLPVTDPVRQALQRELYTHALQQADAALRHGSDDALALLAAARDLAPDTATWIEVQAAVLARTSGDRARFVQELDRLERKAPDGTFPAGEGVPVTTWVAWQRARTAADPAAAVRAWQELLERHGERSLGDETAGAAAQRHIAELMREHGERVYAAIDARARKALTDARDDREALAAVARTFPNSAAAAEARVRLLDAAVRAGDLALVCGVLAQALPGGDVPPGIARRVLVAAAQRGNRALADAMAALLRPHAGVESDWPDDRGATYGEVVAALPPAVPTPPPELALPAADLATVRARGEGVQMMPTLPAPGFDVPADVPLYVRAGRDLVAIDVHAAGDDKPVLFSTPTDFLEHVLVCGTTLIVPDMERVFALDYRTGAKRWELPNAKRRILESLGMQAGVLHVSALPTTADGSTELLGVEPLTGSVLFAQSQPATALKAKAIDGALLRLTIERDGALAVQRLDPVGGAVRHTIAVKAATVRPALQLEPDSLSARLYPQAMDGDGERLFLPADSVASTDPPRLLAVGADGALAWQWQGTAGCQLTCAALRGDRFVVVESSDRRASRLVVLRTTDGSPLREVEVGHGARVLNWERSWLANPAPPQLAIESFADADRTQRQFVCVGVDDGSPTFVVTLGRDDGEIVQTPQFGRDFVTFATRAPRAGGAVRLWALRLADRTGALPEGRNRVLALPGPGDGMGRVGACTVVSGVQGLLLLGTRGPR